ncbi:hypothetical protein ACFSQ7_33705 [Paenibacillus rhizoplanae]
MNTKTGGARDAFNFMKQLWTKINADDVQGLGAQLTYYLILSLFPFSDLHHDPDWVRQYLP